MKNNPPFNRLPTEIVDQIINILFENSITERLLCMTISKKYRRWAERNHWWQQNFDKSFRECIHILREAKKIAGPCIFQIEKAEHLISYLKKDVTVLKTVLSHTTLYQVMIKNFNYLYAASIHAQNDAFEKQLIQQLLLATLKKQYQEASYPMLKDCVDKINGADLFALRRIVFGIRNKFNQLTIDKIQDLLVEKTGDVVPRLST